MKIPTNTNKLDHATKMQLVDCDCAIQRSVTIKCKYFLSKLIILTIFVSLNVVCGSRVTTTTETSTHCPDCRMGDPKEVARVIIQQRLLKALEYPEEFLENQKKNPMSYPPVSRFIQDIYSEIEGSSHNMRHPHNGVQGNEVEDESVQVEGAFCQSEKCPDCLKYEGYTPILFKLENSTDYKVITLDLYINDSEKCRENISIEIHQLKSTMEGIRYIPIKTVDRQPDTKSWIHIDFKNEIENQFKTPSFTNNITLVILASYKNKEASLRNANCPTLNNPIQNALLKFQYREKSNKRSKRTVEQKCKENQNNTNCCRYPLVIDFDELKWDFIITPRRYEAYYCAGECPYLYKQSIPHTHLMQQMTTKGRACCSPKKMSAISMLYFTARGTILYGKIGGMIVDKCGCS